MTLKAQLETLSDTKEEDVFVCQIAGKMNLIVLDDKKPASFVFVEGEGMRVIGKPSPDTWEHAGRILRAFEGSIQWWVGDWVTYGEGHFQERVDQAVDATDWKEPTVLQYARVAKQVPHENRHPDLSFSVHREVADLPPAEQKQWLQKAVDGDGGTKWGSDRLRAELRQAKTPHDTTCWLLVRCLDASDREFLAQHLRTDGREVKLP